MARMVATFYASRVLSSSPTTVRELGLYSHLKRYTLSPRAFITKAMGWRSVSQAN